MNHAVSPYPWDAVPKVPRRAVAVERRLRQALRDAFDVGELPGALASVLAAEVRIAVHEISPSPPARADRSIHVATTDGCLHLTVEPEAAFASVLLSRILERPVRLVDAEASLEPVLRGALTALAVEVARRAAGSSELVVVRDAPSEDGIRVRATILLDGRPYGVSVWAAAGASPRAEAARAVSIAALGETPISVPVVAAESAATTREIAELSPGDVWMPGAGWFYRSSESEQSVADARSTLERAVLAAPSNERGVAIGHSEHGKIVLLGTVVALARDVPDPEPSSDDSKMGGQEEDLNQVVLDSPVVVRVEIGSVTLTAREWAAVRAGDVIETGLRLAEPVVLRIAGKEVARGELVNIEGELGVRIKELVAPGRSP